MIQIHQDWKEWLSLLNSEGVDYLVIGGIAVGFHGLPRYTADIDLLVRATKENGERIVKALEKFGFGSLMVQPDAFCGEDKLLALGNEPLRIDIFTSIPGVRFEEAWPRRSLVHIDTIPVSVLSFDDLVSTKQAVGRPQDLADVSRIIKIKERGLKLGQGSIKKSGPDIDF